MGVKNIILISIDALRYDCVGYQPDKRELIKYDVLKHLETSTLDRIAQKSLCFTQCISTATYTTSSHASIFTGLYPPRHGVRGFYDTKLYDGVYTLAEVLKVFGYRTVFFTDAPVVFVPPGLTRGFDHVFVYDEPGLMKLLEENKNDKVFLFAHFFDVHEPYMLTKNLSFENGDYHAAIESLHERFDIRPSTGDDEWTKWNAFVQKAGRNTETLFPYYVKGVSKFDRIRFRLFLDGLERFGFFEDGLSFIFSDHGEGRMYDSYDCREMFHDGRDSSLWFGHGGALFDNVIRVPLIVQHRDLPHSTPDRLVSMVDVFPTVIQLATGKELNELLPYNIDGLSLIAEEVRGEAYCEKWNGSMGLDQPWERFSFLLWQRALRTDRMKFILYGEPEALSRENVADLSDTDFLRLLYRKLKASFETYDEYMRDLRMLRTGKISRSDLLSQAGAEHFKMYDLERDPFEESPVTDAVNPELVSHFKTRLFELCSASVQAEKIFPPLDREVVRRVAERMLMDQLMEPLDAVCESKNLFNELIKTFFEGNKNVSDEGFFRKCFGVFLGVDPPENAISGLIDLVNSGLSRKAVFDSHFMKKVFSSTEPPAGGSSESMAAPPVFSDGDSESIAKLETWASESIAMLEAQLADRQRTIQEKDAALEELRLKLGEAWQTLGAMRRSKTWRLGQLYGRLFGKEAKWRKSSAR